MRIGDFLIIQVKFIVKRGGKGAAIYTKRDANIIINLN